MVLSYYSANDYQRIMNICHWCTHTTIGIHKLIPDDVYDDVGNIGYVTTT